MNVNCTAKPCPVILDATCVFYSGGKLLYTGIKTNDNLQIALEKIDAKFQDANIGYIFENGVIQSSPGQPVKLGGSLTGNTIINSAGFTFALTGTIESQSFITTGGTSSDFVKGDGSLDSTSYQPAGAYITSLTGDGTASGPGSAVFTLSNSGVIANTYGSASLVPVITVDAKGRVTNVNNTPINYPPQLLFFSGDVGGAGQTGSNVTLTLNNVNSGVFPAITPLKFSVNAKGLVTGASPLTNLDIFSIIGYTPVPQTRTITINGVTQNLSANRTWTVDTLPSQTGNAGKWLTTNGTIASWQNLPPSGVSNVTASGPITSSGGATPNISTSMNTNRLIGRGSAGVGVMEEILLGTGLSLSGNTLNATAVFTPAALTKTDDTNVTLTLTGNPSTALLQNVNIAVGWTGTLNDSRITSAATWNAKQDAITLTTLGSSGPATFIANTLNIPQYTDQFTGTVTSVELLAGTGISLSGTNPITTSGTITVTNSAPDQTVALTSGTGINITGTYPNFTITNTSPSSGGTVTSVGLSMPSAFAVTNSPVTSSGTLTVAGAGTSGQYVRGDGSLGIFPTVGGGGGGSVYYLNGNTNQGTFGGVTMYQLSKIPGTGAAANFTRNTAGTIATFITDANDPNQVTVPAGIWIFHCYFSETGGGANHAQIQAVVEKWNGISITVIGTGVIEEITNGNTKDLYTLGVTIPSGVTLNLTDRIVVQILIANPQGKTVTLYTEDGDLSSVTTTFANGISSINGLTAAAQTLGTGTTGTDFNISSSGSTHAFNLPVASAINTGKLSSTDWSNFNTAYTNRITSLTTTGSSGAATLISNTLNIPNYTLSGLGGVPTSRTLTINGTALDLSADRSWSVGTVTSVAALTLGTSGTDLSSSVANNTTTPVITLNVPTASSTNRGALSSTDWGTFNNKPTTFYQNTTPTGTGTSAIIEKSFWTHSDTGLQYTYINDGNTYQWVQVTLPLGPQGPQGANGTNTVNSLTTTTFSGLLKGNGSTLSATTVGAELGYTAENVANKENVTLDNSSTKYPTNNLVKTSLDSFADDVDYAIMTNQRLLFNF